MKPPLDAERVPCSVSPDSWFPETGDAQTAKLAKHICKTRCPLVEACAEYGIRHETGAGIFGGLTSEERRRARVARGIVASTPPLGIAYPRRAAS